MLDPDDPTTWPIDTIIVRGGIGGARELAERRSASGTWSVVAAPSLPLEEHCDLGGLTAIDFDGILGPPVPNPVPAHSRWRP